MSGSHDTVSLDAATRPLSSLEGYKPGFVVHDIVAGIVIAALSIPIAIGYAGLAGLPPEYGLYASFIAPLVYALTTGTRHVVFGLDSATSAITGSMLIVMGVSLGTGVAVQVMPLLTLFVALFLFLFSVVKAGKIIRLVPIPVMHGFIAGISVTVIVTQIPLLLGTTADMAGPFWQDVVSAGQAFAAANAPSLVLAVFSAVIICALKRWAPSVPRALVALALSAVVTMVFDLTSQGVVTLDSARAGFPLPTLPDVSAFNVLHVAGAALVIAIVVALESLLCLEVFSVKSGTRSQGNRELFSFGAANLVCSLFACPPCSASISRTAAGVSAGGKTQAASLVSALTVALVVLFCGPVLRFLPQATLSVIVTIALIEVCDFGKIARYARHMKIEFFVFMVAFVSVIVFGAVPGILLGFAIALVFALYRKRKSSDDELLGAVPYGKYDSRKKKGKPDPGIDYRVVKMGGELDFLNVDKAIDEAAKQVADDVQAMIFNLNGIVSLDTTATDKIVRFFDMLLSRGIYVKVVRKVRPTNDRYTRFELRQIMHQVKFYPSVPFALLSLKSDLENQIDPQHAIGWLKNPVLAFPNEGDRLSVSEAAEDSFRILEGDNPALTVINWEEGEGERSVWVLHGRIAYLQSQESLIIEAGYDPNKKVKSKDHLFFSLLITREKDGEVLARYEKGEWEWHEKEEILANAIMVTDSYLRKVRSTKRHDITSS